jgi:hypothetical protein
MDPYIQAFLFLTGFIVLSGAAVIWWCIATDDRYMEEFRRRR